ncbi:M24 family metallopeptidase [soil metagenome]
MQTLVTEHCERTGENFRWTNYFDARQRGISAVDRIFSNLQEGMSEAEGQQLVKEEFLKDGAEKFWHPSKFRIGADTVKTFRAAPEDSIRLQKGDILFVDVGPIFDGHEADIGRTQIFGETSDESLKRLMSASREVWMKTANAWKTDNLSGEALYTFAGSLAEGRGYKLNPLMAGHRLGDFPHALFSKDKLSEMKFRPSENLWVLEIHLIDDSLARGSFYEDILS